MNKKIPEKMKMFLMPLVVIPSIALASVVFLGPQVTAILTDQKELALEKSKLAKLTAKTAFLEGLQEPELETKTKTALAFLPVERDLPRLLAVIRNLADSGGLELRGIQVGAGDVSTDSASPKPGKTVLEPLEVRIVVGGDWDQLKNLLVKIEEASPLMRAAKVDVISFPPAIEATLIVKSFSLSLPATLGASETPAAAISPQEEETYQHLAKVVPLIEEAPPSASSPTGRENPFAF